MAKEVIQLKIGDQIFEIVDGEARKALDYIGSLDDLATKEKSSLVAAINELVKALESGSGGSSGETLDINLINGGNANGT